MNERTTGVNKKKEKCQNDETTDVEDRYNVPTGRSTHGWCGNSEGNIRAWAIWTDVILMVFWRVAAPELPLYGAAAAAAAVFISPQIRWQR